MSWWNPFSWLTKPLKDGDRFTIWYEWTVRGDSIVCGDMALSKQNVRDIMAAVDRKEEHWGTSWRIRRNELTGKVKAGCTEVPLLLEARLRQWAKS